MEKKIKYLQAAIDILIKEVAILKHKQEHSVMFGKYDTLEKITEDLQEEIKSLSYTY